MRTRVIYYLYFYSVLHILFSLQPVSSKILTFIEHIAIKHVNEAILLVIHQIGTFDPLQNAPVIHPYRCQLKNSTLLKHIPKHRHHLGSFHM